MQKPRAKVIGKLLYATDVGKVFEIAKKSKGVIGFDIFLVQTSSLQILSVGGDDLL